MFPVFGVVEGFLGARASRPHNDWHGLGNLLHLDRPAAAPWLSFGLAVVVTADVVAACKAARKLSDHHKQQHAGGTPALPGDKGQDAGGTPGFPGGGTNPRCCSLYSDFSNASTWPFTLTLPWTSAMWPSSSITKVERTIPMYFLPYMDFSCQAP